MVFHCSICKSKFPQISRTLLSILDNLNNEVVRMVSIHPPISYSSGLLTKPWEIVPSARVIIGITATFMFHSSLASSKYLSLFSFTLIFPLYSTGTAGSTIQEVHFFSCKLSLNLVFWSGLGDVLVSQNPIEFCASHSSGIILGFAFTMYCTIPSGSRSPPNRILSCTLFGLVEYKTRVQDKIRLGEFATFVYYVINSFVSITTKHILTILFCIIYFPFYLLAPNGVVLCCY